MPWKSIINALDHQNKMSLKYYDELVCLSSQDLESTGSPLLIISCCKHFVIPGFEVFFLSVVSAMTVVP